jgi:glucosyl-3-phosphoglycerate synthase
VESQPPTTEEGQLRLDEWFSARSFSSREFGDIDRLHEAKRQRGIAVTVILPTRNVVGTIGPILDEIASLDRSGVRLFDQVLVVDAQSTDGTLAAASREGVEVWRAELGKQRVNGKAGDQHGGDEEADRFGSPRGAQSTLVLDAVVTDLDSGDDLESAVRRPER